MDTPDTITKIIVWHDRKAGMYRIDCCHAVGCATEANSVETRGQALAIGRDEARRYGVPMVWCDYDGAAETPVAEDR